MSLKEFITRKRINRETFIALHNKDNKWIICNTLESNRLNDYLNCNVIEDIDIKLKGQIKIIKIDYAESMSLESIRFKEKQREVVEAKKKRK